MCKSVTKCIAIAVIVFTFVAVYDTGRVACAELDKIDDDDKR